MARAAIDAGQARVAWLGDDSRIRVVQTRGSQAAQSLAEKDHLVQQLTTICWGPSKVVVETSDAQPVGRDDRVAARSIVSSPTTTFCFVFALLWQCVLDLHGCWL